MVPQRYAKVIDHQFTDLKGRDKLFGKSAYFFYKAVLFGLATVVVIPRQVYKKFLIYGLIFGAILDVIFIIILGPILHLVKYIDMGPFSIFGIFSFWTPVAWMFAFMLFFYFLPVRKEFLYPYTVSFALFGYMVGLVLQGLGLFMYVGNYLYIAPLVLTGWFSLSAWAYIRSEHITLK